MKIEVEDKGSYHVFHCSGVLGGTVGEFANDSIHPLIERGKARILFDLEGVDRITTNAISVFVTLVSRANAKGSRVVFVNLSPFVQAVFDTTQIYKFLETEESIEAGVERLLASEDQRE